MAGSGWQVRRGAHAETSAPAPRTLTPYLWVGLVSVAAQIVTVLSAPRALYFPDSYCYVQWQHCASHSPAVEWYWQILTFGSMTEVTVLSLQVILGVASALLLTGALICLTPRWVAIAGGVLVAIFPMNLLLERVLLPETLQTFFLSLFLFAAARALTTEPKGRQLGFGALGFLALGLLASVHASVIAAVVVVAAIFFVALLTRLRRREHVRSVASMLGAGILAGLLLVIPLIPVSARMHAAFGVFTPNPASATYLAGSWAPLLDCPPKGDLTAVATAELTALCDRPTFKEVPGRAQDIIFVWPYTSVMTAVTGTAPDGSMLTKATFKQTQAELRRATINGISRHPVAFVHEVLRSLWWQATGPLQRPYPPYRTWTGPRAAKPAWPTAVAWLDGAVVGGDPDADQGFVDLAEGTAWLTQVFLWLAILGGVVRLCFALGARRSGERFKLERTARVSMGITAAMFVAVSMGTVAVAGHPSTRYSSELFPALVILCALVVPRKAVVPTVGAPSESAGLPG